MLHVNNGQCGLCEHFGEHSTAVNTETLIRIRRSGEADEGLVAECGHPKNEKLHLKVTPISGCDGFRPANGVIAIPAP